MDTKDIVIGVSAVLGTAVLGYVGYKCFKGNDKKVEAKVVAAPKAAERSTLSLKPTASVTPVEKPIQAPEPEVAEPVQVEVPVLDTPVLTVEEELKQALKETAPPMEDEVKQIALGDDKVVSISRPRVGNHEYRHSAGMPPFWEHFYNNIRRQEVIQLNPADFSNGKRPELSKGYHRAQITGFADPAIVHVTKGHVSAVVYLGGTCFMGFSTSGSRFQKGVSGEGVPGTFSLTATQAKDFLNGR